MWQCCFADPSWWPTRYDAEAVVVNLHGQLKELDPGNWKPADKATIIYTVSATKN